MFFSWLIENKHFKKGSDIKGQITPLLIVIMVVLLILALVTINVGRVALDKTYSSSASDAGALAAASIYAAAFNELTQDNHDYLWMTYVKNYAAMSMLHDEAQDDLDYAIAFTLTGLALLDSAYYYLLAQTPALCPVVLYTYYSSAAWFFAASAAFTMAGAYTNQFIAAASLMRSLVDSHHLNTYDAYCQLRKMMDDYNSSSNDTGYSYAFSNSGILDKLSKEQQNTFSSWLSDSAQYTSGIYSWQDKLTQNHTVNVNVAVPAITSYELQHTNYGYHKEGDLIDSMISTGNTIVTILGIQASLCAIASTFCLLLTAAAQEAFTTFWTGVDMMAACCPCCAFGCCGCCAAGAALIVKAVFVMTPVVWAKWGYVTSLATGIIVVIDALVTIGTAIGLFILKDETDDALYGFGMDNVFSSISCKDAKDLLIVKISEVILPTWKITCCETQTHPGSSQGLFTTAYPSVRSCAKASFDGGDVGSFTDTYDSKITD